MRIWRTNLTYILKTASYELPIELYTPDLDIGWWLANPFAKLMFPPTGIGLGGYGLYKLLKKD